MKTGDFAAAVLATCAALTGPAPARAAIADATILSQVDPLVEADGLRTCSLAFHVLHVDDVHYSGAAVLLAGSVVVGTNKDAPVPVMVLRLGVIRLSENGREIEQPQSAAPAEAFLGFGEATNAADFIQKGSDEKSGAALFFFRFGGPSGAALGSASADNQLHFVYGMSTNHLRSSFTVQIDAAKADLSDPSKSEINPKAGETLRGCLARLVSGS